MWKSIDISSKEIITKYTKGLFEICDYNFVNLLTWSEGDNIQYKIENDILYMKGNYLGESSYFFPISLNCFLLKRYVINIAVGASPIVICAYVEGSFVSV